MNGIRVILSTLNLAFILALSIPKILINRKKAVKSFKKELSSMGLDDDVIEILASDYKHTVNFKKFSINNSKEKSKEKPKEKKFIYKKERVSQSM